MVRIAEAADKIEIREGVADLLGAHLPLETGE
jgi:hypothetical protein